MPKLSDQTVLKSGHQIMVKDLLLTRVYIPLEGFCFLSLYILLHLINHVPL